VVEVLRGWRTQTGLTLVEGAAYQPGNDPYPVLTPAGTPLGVAHTYYQVDALGAVTTIHRWDDGADSDYLYATAHLVERSELCEYFCSYNTSSTESRPWTTRSVLLAGLVALAPAELPSSARLDAAVYSHLLAREARAQRAQQAEQRDAAARRARFVSALPTPRDGRPINLVFEYQPGTKQKAIVVRHADGPVIFLEQSYRYHGKYLFKELEDILAEHYGKQPYTLVAHLPDWDTGLAFNPD